MLSTEALNMNVRIVRGADADLLLADEAFRTHWATLFANCPWATVFQSPDFACTWYQSYRRQFEPVLVLTGGPDGTISGLLPLASLADQLGVAGLWQAEYQVWISRPNDANEFITQALVEIRRAFPRASLCFSYLPPGTPVDWIRVSADRRLMLLRRDQRPSLLIGDGHSIRASLAKNNNKSRIRALNKIGPVTLEHVTDARRFEELLPTLAVWYDARRLALNGLAPFREDPLKGLFHLAMLKGAAHVTVLKAGQRPVSMQFNLCSRGAVHTCLMAHDPFFAKQSPGKLHFYYLALMLRDAGFKQIDLTPGPDAYKERFADAWDHVHELSVHPTRSACLSEALAYRSRRIARRILRKADVSPARAEHFAHRIKARIKSGGARAVLRSLGHWVASDRHRRIYTCSVNGGITAQSTDALHVDVIADLLAYVPDPGGPSARQFIDDAINRIARGQHFYSCVQGGRLMHIAWLLPKPTQETLNEFVPSSAFPKDSGLVDGWYTAHCAQSRGLLTSSLRAIVDATRNQKVGQLFLVVDSRDTAAISQIEAAGFLLERRAIEQVRFGIRRLWKDQSNPANVPASPDSYIMQVPNA
jgi:CelD/BcsL family acetyltransferase involved in cellulose biosynthesis